MKNITTRELLTNHKAVQSRLAAGESITWTSRGKVIAQLSPPKVFEPINLKRPDWVKRAREAGAINTEAKSVSAWVSEDRGE